jgi:hypothetical protein
VKRVGTDVPGNSKHTRNPMQSVGASSTARTMARHRAMDACVTALSLTSALLPRPHPLGGGGRGGGGEGGGWLAGGGVECTVNITSARPLASSLLSHTHSLN